MGKRRVFSIFNDVITRHPYRDIDPSLFLLKKKKKERKRIDTMSAMDRQQPNNKRSSLNKIFSSTDFSIHLTV